jgi:hypothetical protein
MLTFILGIALIGLGLFLAYMACADDRHRADWQAQQVADQYAAALAPSRDRHPGGRDL